MDPESLGNTTSNAPRKVRFAPKGPPRRVQKPVVPKIEKTETIDTDAQAQELLTRFNEASGKVKPKVEKKEGDYATFIQTHLMPPLTGVRGGEGARAPAAREGGRRARATRSRRRRDSGERQRQELGWPELPTSVTYRRRSGETYQIPIEPAPVGHALVGVRGSTPASIEYTRQALELVASLIGMLQTSLDLLSLYRIPIPFEMLAPSGAPAGAAAGPSAPPPAAERRGRQAQTHGRGRARGIRSESGPSKPILGDDDDETSEEVEAASLQSESSDGGGDDTGSDSASREAGEAEEGSSSGSDPASGSGADGDSAPESAQPRKKMKRASQS